MGAASLQGEAVRAPTSVPREVSDRHCDRPTPSRDHSGFRAYRPASRRPSATSILIRDVGQDKPKRFAAQQFNRLIGVPALVGLINSPSTRRP
jgi:hypothetical protein